MRRTTILSVAALSLAAFSAACASTTPRVEAPAEPYSPAPIDPTPVADPAPIAAPAPAPFDQKYLAASTRLFETIQKSPKAWDRLAYFCDTFGHRLSGSRSLERAIDWAVDTLKADGLTTARREKVMVTHWVRGNESARIVKPVERELVLLGLGNTIGTGPRGVTAEVVVVRDLAELDTRASELSGRIALVNQPMPPFDAESGETGYEGTVKIRGQGASAAARHGARALLIRSVTAFSLRTPHTGSLRYADDAPKIPAAALSPSDADFLERMVERGSATVELKLGAKMLPDAESANVVAEIPGRELPNEVVLIGGHIDSWDVGQGAHDNGSGVVMVMRAAELLHRLGLVPRRTVRLVLFTNEENGLRGSKSYFEAHGQEKHAAAIEADTGGGAPRGFRIGKTEADVLPWLPFAPLFQPFAATDFREGGGGADISALVRAGVLGLSIAPDISRYFDYHHSPADMVDTIDPWDLERNAGALALMAYILAERD